MKRTLTINIAGIVFHIDEDAYDQLKSYLQNLSTHFSKEEGGHEIVNDIESRIAELFSERTENAKGVISSEMAGEIIEIMGLPEDFEGEESAEESQEEKQSENSGQQQSHQSYQTKKRLYRDPDSRIFGGVCSGLAQYFNMEKSLIRVLFVVLLIITSGIALPAYLILWIAVPKAKSTAERLEMRGQAINAENIGKKVREEYNDVKNNFNKYANSEEFKNAKAKAREYGHRAGDSVRDAGRGSANALSKLFGILFMIIGFASLAGLIFAGAALGNIAGIIPGLHHGLFINQLFSNSLTGTLLVATFIIVGMPILLLIYAGTKLMFNYVSNSRSVVFTALGVWVIAIIIAISSAIGALDVFSTEASESNKETLYVQQDTLILKVDDEHFGDYASSRIKINNFKIVVIEDEELLISRPEFDIFEADENEMILRIRKYSKGNNYRSAKENAGNIDYSYKLQDNTLLFDPYFLLDDDSKWRNQEVKITLYLPLGKTVYLDESMLPIIYDIKNTTNTWDGDMPGKYWTMTEKGLALSK